ncbi:hypothetical protein [Streptomyces sp. HNM0575]|uniref:hypothetical protein n=1 Tax=Streptomyces sp. HNM0575 TaxID=2716338 RepID=UPI0032177F95
MLLGAAAGVALTVVLAAVLWWPRSETVYRSHQPSQVTYGDKFRHHAGLVRVRSLAGDESYRLTVGRDPGLSYGHAVEIDAALGEAGIESSHWTAAGLRIEFGSGHTLFVPARQFTYGR